jgi:predicted transcriptional regulator
MHPTYPSLCLSILDKVDEFSLFLSPSVLERLEKEKHELAEKLLSSASSNVFLIKETINMPILCVTEKFLYFSIFNKDGRYEHRDILSFDESAVLWGRELIEYYGKRSSAIKMAGS